MTHILFLLVLAVSQAGATGLQGQLATMARQLAASGDGRLGVGVELLETGERVTVGETFRYPMQSTYKLPIAMAVLAAVDDGRLRLDQPVKIRPSDFVSPGQRSPVRDANPKGVELPLEEVLRLNVSESDGTACDVLLDLLGGPERVTSWLRGHGVAGMVVATSEKAMGARYQVQFDNWTTPAGALEVLRALHEGRGLSPRSRALLLRFTTETATGPKRLKGLLPAGTVLAHKTGTSGSRGGVTAATNDIGIITLPGGQQHLAVAVLLTNSRLDEAGREAIIARVARLAYDTYSSPRVK
jgi:beta-lactamase class A